MGTVLCQPSCLGQFGFLLNSSISCSMFNWVWVSSVVTSSLTALRKLLEYRLSLSESNSILSCRICFSYMSDSLPRSKRASQTQGLVRPGDTERIAFRQTACRDGGRSRVENEPLALAVHFQQVCQHSSDVNHSLTFLVSGVRSIRPSIRLFGSQFRLARSSPLVLGQTPTKSFSG